MLDDVVAVLTYLGEVEGVDAARISMVSCSFGAAIAMLEPDQFKFVVVWGQMGDVQAEFHEYDKAAAEGAANVGLGWRVVALKQGFLDRLATHNLAERFAGYSGPFLTIAGDADPAAAYFEQYVGIADGRAESLAAGGHDPSESLQRIPSSRARARLTPLGSLWRTASSFSTP